MPTSLEYLDHSFAVPRLPRAVIVPRALQERLDSAGRLYVIRAAPGFGKTTIAAWWATRGASTTALWIDLEPSDQADTVRSKIEHAMWSVGAKKSGTPSHSSVRVVLRHGEHLPTGELAEVVSWLLGAFSHVRVLVAMRLRGPIAELRELVYFADEVTAADLRCGPSEVQELARVLGIPISPGSARDLAEQSHGWPAMVAAVISGAAQGQGLDWEAGVHFFNRIFNNFYTQDQKLRDLALSVPERMTEGLATELLGEAYPLGYLDSFGEEGECPLLPRPAGGEYRSSSFMRGAATRILFEDFPLRHREVHVTLSSRRLRSGDLREALWHGVISRDHVTLEKVVRERWGTLALSCPDLLEIALDQLLLGNAPRDPLWGFLENLETLAEGQRAARKLLVSSSLEDRVLCSRAKDVRSAEFFNKWGWAQFLHAMPTNALYAFWRAHESSEGGSCVNDEARMGISLCLAQVGYTGLSRHWSVPSEDIRSSFLTAALTMLTLIWRDDAGGEGGDSGSSTGSEEDRPALSRRLEDFTSRLLDHVHHSLSDAGLETVRKTSFDRGAEPVQTPEFTPLDVWERGALAHLGFRVPRAGDFAGHAIAARADTSAWAWAAAIRQHVIRGDYPVAMEASAAVPDEVRLLPRPWVSILLSRSIAAHRSGRGEAASEALHQAAAVSTVCTVSAPFLLMVPGEIMEVAGTVPQVAETLENRASSGAQTSLTPQQQLLLRELSSGAPLAVIARRLYLAPSTVKAHLSRIYRRLGVSNRDEAVVRAQALRLLIRDT